MSTFSSVRYLQFWLKNKVWSSKITILSMSCFRFLSLKTKTRDNFENVAITIQKSKLAPAPPANIYLPKVNYGSTRKRCEICSKFTIKITEWGQWHCSTVFIVNKTYFAPFCGLFIVDLEQVNICLTGKYFPISILP